MDTVDESKPVKKTSLLVFVILFFLSLGLNIFLFFQYVRNAVQLEQDNTELIALLDASNLRADSLQTELDRTIALFQTKLDESFLMETDLRDELEQKIVDLERTRVRISNLIAQGGDGGSSGTVSLVKAKAQIDDLKKSNTAYLSELDELKKVYAIAQDAADNFSGKVSYYQDQNDSLIDANDTLEHKMKDLARLQIADLTVLPQRTKKDVLIPTFKASKAENLKIEFSVLRTRGILPGTKIITIRVIGTAGEVLLDDLDNLTDSDKLISMTHSFKYTGAERRVKVTYEQKAKFKSGNHTVEIYQNGNLLDRISFDLE